MSLLSRLADRYRNFSRAARWGAWAVAAIAAYFALIEPVLDLTNRLRDRADMTAAALSREHALAQAAPDKSRALFGSPALPVSAERAKDALYKRVEQIFNEHRIRPDITERSSPIRAPEADALAQPEERIDRLILDLTFEAPPETVTQVLAQLEQAPEIAAVGRVQLRRVESGRSAGPSRPGNGSSNTPSAAAKLRATLAAESWVRASKGARS